MSSVRLDGAEVQAVVFDMDGVVTDTRSTHAAAWKRVFDALLSDRAARSGEPFEPFDLDSDYRLNVDGRSRHDGVRTFLASRNISIPDGNPSDPPEAETVCGLGNRKNEVFLESLRAHGVSAYPSTVELLWRLRELRALTAVISASSNARAVLSAAGVIDLFDVRVDGVDAEALRLPGKPDPAIFLEAARRLGIDPSQAAVVEDALPGVEAGRRGGFALVIGVDRTRHANELKAHGADLVVSDLRELRITPARLPGNGRPQSSRFG